MLVQIENEIYKFYVYTEDGIKQISREAEKLELAPAGNNMNNCKVKYTDAGKTFELELLENDLFLKLANDGGASMKKLNELLKKVSNVGEMLNRLDKAKLTGADLRTFIEDLTSKPDLLSHFNSTGLLGDVLENTAKAWKVLNMLEGT